MRQGTQGRANDPSRKLVGKAGVEPAMLSRRSYSPDRVTSFLTYPRLLA